MSFPTIPEYYAKHISSAVNLVEEPKQCCPFHKEDTPSFSYSSVRKSWRCFGSCKIGGDVVELHRANFKFKSREEAKKSLEQMYGVLIDISRPILDEHINVDLHKVEFDTLYNRCLMYANTVERWLDFDYVMSQYPVESLELKELLKKWGYNSEDNRDPLL